MTRLLVLGLLIKYGPMSGYDIQMGLEQAEVELWLEVKPPSIYYALKKLEEENSIAVECVEKTGNRTRTVYCITEQGKCEYKRYLISSLGEVTVAFPGGLYAAASFVEDVPAAEAVKALQLQLQKTEELLQKMRRGEKQKEEITSITNVIFEHIYNTCQAQKDCIHKIIEYLSK